MVTQDKITVMLLAKIFVSKGILEAIVYESLVSA